MRNNISISILILIMTLALISTWFLVRQSILPFIDKRIDLIKDIFDGGQKAEFPYQYRLLEPALGNVAEGLLGNFIQSPRKRHAIAHASIALVTFTGVFYLFYIFLREFFTEKSSVIGLLLLQAAIPLSITGFYITGDFISLLFYLLGFILMLRRKDIYLPLLVAISTFNRRQMIFLVVFYACYLISQRRLHERKGILIIISCVIAWAVVYFGARLYFGFYPPGMYPLYTAGAFFRYNVKPFLLITRTIPVWSTEVGGYMLLAILAFKKSNLFLKLAFLSLIPYAALFFVNGYIWEFAKFLPAHIIMITMGLQVLTGEFIAEEMGR